MSFKNSIYRTPRTYRFSPTLAQKLHKTANQLAISESKLVRSLLEKGLNDLLGESNGR